ncbi:MAG: hypothetical protein ACREA2_13450, partial [Blastocatellia bacterium]
PELFRRRIMDAKNFIHAVASKVDAPRAMRDQEQEATQNECPCLLLPIHFAHFIDSPRSDGREIVDVRAAGSKF